MTNKSKLYTLEEAYEEILKIKKETIGDPLEYIKSIEDAAFKRGYAKACDHIKEDMNKSVSVLKSIFSS